MSNAKTGLKNGNLHRVRIFRFTLYLLPDISREQKKIKQKSGKNQKSSSPRGCENLNNSGRKFIVNSELVDSRNVAFYKSDIENLCRDANGGKGWRRGARVNVKAVKKLFGQASDTGRTL